MRYQRILLSALLTVLLALTLASRGLAARLYLDSRALEITPKTHGAVNYRELPRQALIVIAAEELGVEIVDASLEPEAKPQPGDIVLGLERLQIEEPLGLQVDLFDATNKLIERFTIPCLPRVPRFMDINALTASMDAEPFRAHWKELLAKQLGVTANPVKWDATLAAPQDTEPYLRSIDFSSSFLAAQITHQAIIKSGNSPARLGALVRAYANLGESTRELYSAQSVAMFARSYVYAQRLLRLAPQDPASWYHRAYLKTLHGLNTEALADLKRGDELAKGAPAESWVGLCRDLLAFDTQKLFEKIDGKDAPMASYFAWRTVEHAPLNNLILTFAKAALQQNPGAMRIVNSIAGNSSIGYSGQVVSLTPAAMAAIIANTGLRTGVPPLVHDAIRAAANQRFAIQPTLTMLTALQNTPREAGQIMPWSAYASLLREFNFLNGLRRLHYEAYQIGPDASGTAIQMYPLLKDHRYAAAIASFDKSGGLSGGNPIEALRAMPLQDDSLSSMWMGLNRHYTQLGIMRYPKNDNSWLGRTSAQCDHTDYDAAAVLWIYRLAPNNSGNTLLRQEVARELEQMCPNHPVALAWRIMEDWPAMKDRADKIERELGDNPMIAYALGDAYVTNKQFDRAAPLLEKAIRYAPDRAAFRQLAEVYLARDDEAGWLRTWDRYFAEAEDTGLDHASARRDIAARLMSRGSFEKALPYARGAAGSGSNWGMEIYGNALTRLGKYDEARQQYQSIASRYNPILLHRWAHETGKLDPSDAAKLVAARLPQIDARADAGELSDAAMYFYLESNLDKANEYWTRSFQKARECYVATFLAMVNLEQNHPDEASKWINDALSLPATNPRTLAYRAAAAEFKKCMGDSKAVPAQVPDIVAVLNDPELSAPRGNLAFMLGKICEIQSHPEEAKTWYRMAMNCFPGNFVGKAPAGKSLRKLGEETYK